VPVGGKPRKLFNWVAHSAVWRGLRYEVDLSGRLNHPKGRKWSETVVWTARKHGDFWLLGDWTFLGSWLPRNAVHFNTPRGYDRNTVERVPGTGVFKRDEQ
jgi:hypothetical protein